MENNAAEETNCTSAIGSRISASKDLCLAPGVAEEIYYATFLFLFLVVLCVLYRKRTRYPTTKRQRQEREKYIDDRIIKKTLEKKRKVSSEDDSSISDMEKGTATTTKELHLRHLFRAQEQGSKLYLSFCTNDEIDLDECAIDDDDTDDYNNQLPHHAAGLPACAICKEDYLEKDAICWSRNEQCEHVFHVECIKPWLIYHNQCPICRNNYLGQKEDHTEDGATIENDNNEPAGNAVMGQPSIPGSEPILERVNTSVDSPTLAEMLQTMNEMHISRQ